MHQPSMGAMTMSNAALSRDSARMLGQQVHQALHASTLYESRDNEQYSFV